MKTIGIIAEYNPFHNGHLKHLEEIKKLEKDLKIKIEEPFYKILDRLVNEEYDTFIITREELEMIKKFLLIQQYRNLKNSFGYSENFNKDGVLSRYNIKDDESLLDFFFYLNSSNIG